MQEVLLRYTYRVRYLYNTTDHYAIERIFPAQNVLFKKVLRAVRVAAFKSPNRSVKF